LRGLGRAFLRNLSTAMMYAFAQRSDCAVWDEPFYAAFLASTGVQHPLREDAIASGETDPDKVIARCTGPNPGGAHLFYQKHMAHHMITGFSRSWIAGVTNVFLIRHPARVIASYVAKRVDPSLDDLGFRQLAELFDQVKSYGQTPIVIDSADIRADPQRSVSRLCATLGLEFDPAMLGWPPGGNPADGVWAAHWYDAVHKSTGFAGPEGPLPEVSPTYTGLLDAALPFYQRLGGSNRAG